MAEPGRRARIVQLDDLEAEYGHEERARELLRRARERQPEPAEPALEDPALVA